MFHPPVRVQTALIWVHVQTVRMCTPRKTGKVLRLRALKFQVNMRMDETFHKGFIQYSRTIYAAIQMTVMRRMNGGVGGESPGVFPSRIQVENAADERVGRFRNSRCYLASTRGLCDAVRSLIALWSSPKR